ncbi:Disease resistance-like protein [Quillaja saponaria]|uniref:Disease resistance-like protein n=1 Tax=Quillaja saponaria TaxID=32244 RepID=A0AAD7PVV4_QUISA|nr:Disease resistance-like protein [Quillaja saponaria]
MAVPGSSSSSLIPKWTFDVFLSFRDDEKLQRGEEISPALFKAIEESRICIVVFSENYATSTWCLDELVKILECKQTKGQFVHPVFYKVDPSDIRKQKSCVGGALALLEKRFDMEKVQKWRLALQELANLSGSHVKNLSGYEYEFTLRIIEDVTSKLDRTLLHVANHPVGLESRIVKVSSVLENWSHDETQMLGIYGLGGIGKTTLARAVYNHISNRFECKSFLSNVRENSTYARGLVKLQKKLLFEMLGDKNIDLGDVNEGICKIKHKLQHTKVLLILDDVEKIDQLRPFVGGCDWFGPGSKIIMTTRDKRLLDAHGVASTHQMEELVDQDALELFCWNAFKRREPNLGHEDISMRAIRHGKNLPLVLEIIGSNLYGKGIDEWKFTLDKYERAPNKEILNILRISYDSLDYTEKQIFLDIACF